MLEKLKYPNINAKLKGMYAKTLTKEDIEDLLKQNTIKDAIIILKSKMPPLEDLNVDAKRIELESKLDRVIINDISKTYRYLDNKTKKVFDSYILKYKIKILKIIWKDLNFGKQEQEIEEFKYWKTIFNDLENFIDVKNTEEFLKQIKAEELRNIFKNNQNTFELDNMITKYYYEKLYLASRESSKKLENIISTQIDLINISSIYRCKRYYGFYDKKYFINYGKIVKENTIQNIENTQSLQQVKYILKNPKNKEIVESSIYDDSKKYMYNKLRKFFIQNEYDISSIIAYFYIKEIERSNIIAIIEGIRYKLPKEEMQKQIIT